MSVATADLPLLDLLGHVVKEPPYCSTESSQLHGYADFVPNDLWTPGSDPTRNYLRLHPQAAEKFVNCLNGMLRASTDGDLEHLTDREIKQSLWRFVSEAWLTRESLTGEAILERVQKFVSDISRPQQDWEILWEIDLLELSEPISIGAVEFFPFSQDVIAQWERPEGHPLTQVDRSHIGKAFARVTVLAGTKEKATLRAKLAIDDALDILRVAISTARSIPDLQRLQRRGMHYYAYLKDNPSVGVAGAANTSLRASLGISGELRSAVSRALDGFGPVLNDELAVDVREPVRRALLAVGQSMTRTDVDTGILDLCSALESLFSTASEPLKAQRIALRYMLVGLTLGDDSYVTRPLGIYDLYLKRNDIIHGSDRRVCTAEDYADLLYVAKNAIERVITVAKANPVIVQNPATLFAYIETIDSLEVVSAFLSNYPTTRNEAAKYVRRLTDWWLSRARLQVAAKERGYTLRERPLQGDHEVVLFPIGSRMQKSIDEETAIVVSRSDPAQANQKAYQERLKVVNGH